MYKHWREINIKQHWTMLLLCLLKRVRGRGEQKSDVTKNHEMKHGEVREEQLKENGDIDSNTICSGL
jgi:hypothetical protein